MRDCYKDWIIKDRDLRVEAINHERAGGVPYAEGAQGMTDDELASLNMLMSQFRLGENSGLAVPFGTKVNIARGTGSDVDKTIKRLDESMARRFLLQLVNLAQGGQHVGSYALSETFPCWSASHRAVVLRHDDRARDRRHRGLELRRG